MNGATVSTGLSSGTGTNPRARESFQRLRIGKVEMYCYLEGYPECALRHAVVCFPLFHVVTVTIR